MNIPRQFYGVSYISKLVNGFQDREMIQNPKLHFHKIDDITPIPLNRATTMELGMNAEVVLQFLRKITEKKSCALDGLAIAKDGKLLFAGYRPPYKESIPHITNSTCKTVTAIAVMFAISENLVTEEDTVLSFFPEYETLLTPRYVKQINIRHLLTMTSGSKCNEVSAMIEDNWVKAFLLSECQYEPGSKFVYNSMNTYMLSAILCKVTGKSLMEYLRPRLFEPLGINHIKWEVCSLGYERGGWGLHISIENMVKIGFFLANDGMYNGNQLLAKPFVKRMKTECVPQDADFLAKDYGFQLWHLPGSLYMTSGMYGQHIIIDEAHNLIVATNAHCDKMFPDSALVKYVLSFMNHEKLYEPQNIIKEKMVYHTLVQGFHAFCKGYRITDAADKQNVMLPFSVFEAKQERCKKSETEKLNHYLKRLDHKRLHVDQAAFKFFPYLMQGMYQCPPFMVSDISFKCGNDKISLCFYKENGKMDGAKRERIIIEAGHNAYCYQNLLIGENHTEVAVKAGYATDEDNYPVILFEIVFLSAGFSRIIKIFLQEERIAIECMEYPDMLAIVEQVLYGDTVLAGNTIDLTNKLPESMRIMLEHKVEPRMFGVLK